VPKTWVGLLRSPLATPGAPSSFLSHHPSGTSYGTAAPASQRPVDVRSNEGPNPGLLLRRRPVTLRCSNVSTRCHAPSKSVDTQMPSTREKTCPFPPSVHEWTDKWGGWKRCGGSYFPLIHQQKSPQSSAKATDVRDEEKGHKGGWHLATLGGRHSRHPFGRFAPSPSAALRAPHCTRCAPLPHQRCASLGCPWSHRFASGTSYPTSAVAALGQRLL
jgi:hypothetical protein